MKVWLPSPLAELLQGRLPAELDVDVYDGGAKLPGSVGEVEVYVLPYDLGPEPAEVARALPRLRLVQTLTAGVDSYRALIPAGVTLCSARGVHDASTAELAVGLMIASLRRIGEAAQAQLRGAWGADRAESLADKVVLIVGYGAIGAAIERRLAGFECEVVRVARSARDGVSGFAELPGLLARVDVVVLTLPMTDETRGLVDAAFLARLPDGALLVNIARGPVVRTEDLLAEVRSGRLRAALDVTDPEPLPADHPLWRAPGVLITPHVGGNSSAFLPRAAKFTEEQLRRYVAGEPLQNVVSGAY